jgi:predicted RND superfamily exporter protein
VKSRDGRREGFYGWMGETIEQHSGWLIFGTVAATLLLLLPLFLMKPTEMASDSPTGSDVVRWHEEIENKFPYEIYNMLFIAEASDGDMLTQENLYALLLREQALRTSDLSPLLHSRYSETAGTTIHGVYSMADAVDAVLRLGSGGMIDLSNATDPQVKLAVHHLLLDPRSKDLEIQLSAKASYQEGPDGIRLWESPALQFIVESNDGRVRKAYGKGEGDSGASSAESFGKDIALEEFGRDVQMVLRGDHHSFGVWGVGLDVNLEIEDEGRISTPMIIAAVALMFILVTVIFRSLPIALVSAIGLGMLMIWLKGFSNLVGLKDSIIVDMIVPVAILVLGIDYAIHALFRYREEKAKGNPPRQALGNSTCRVGSALVLAMLTTVIAFGANASSGIESVVGFGIAASIAIFASLIILGLFVPAVVMRYDTWRSESTSSPAPPSMTAFGRSPIGALVSLVTRRWPVTLLLVALVTSISAWGWANLDTKLDPKEAFDPRSDLVVGLDKLDEHVEKKLGEPALLYIKGDFTQRATLDALEATIEQMQDNEHVARRSSDGRASVRAPLFTYLESVIENGYSRQQVEATSGVAIADADGDLIPDTPEQLLAIYDHITEMGIEEDEGATLYTAQRIRQTLFHNRTGVEDDAVLMWVGVPGTREQAVVKASAAEINQDMDRAMGNVPSVSFYGLTGEAYVRDAQFDAVTGSMNRSLMIAAVACLILLMLIFRSFRYAVATLIPVLLVASWLYGFMYATGYHLNMMTATIAAISIGLGIDFSIHFTERFRQELRLNPDKMSAIIITARSTGVALFGTALSTALGFAVIGFAPMPMFSAFGLLTSMMIALSFFMALFVLPSLLLLLTPSGTASKL